MIVFENVDFGCAGCLVGNLLLIFVLRFIIYVQSKNVSICTMLCSTSESDVCSYINASNIYTRLGISRATSVGLFVQWGHCNAGLTW